MYITRRTLHQILAVSILCIFPTRVLAQERATASNWVIFDKENSPLSSNSVTSVLQDNRGIYWVSLFPDRMGSSSVGGGLTRFDGNAWQSFTTSNSPLPSNAVQFVAAEATGRIWVATLGGGIASYDGVQWLLFNRSNSPLPSNDIYHIAVEDNGTVWLGTLSDGVVKYDGATWTIYNTGNSGLPSNIINFIVIDAQGTKWIGTDFGGLVSFDGNHWQRHGQGPFTPSFNLVVTAMSIDAQNQKWVAGLLAGGEGILAKFKDDSWTFFDSTAIGFRPYVSYNGIAIDHLNAKWMAANVGLIKYNDTTWTLYSSQNSPIPANWFRPIRIDARGNKISGLYSFDSSAIISHGLVFFNESGVVIRTSVEEKSSLPLKYSLQQNHPNPFNPTTAVVYSIAEFGPVTLKVYDLSGKEVAVLVNEDQKPGVYHAVFDAGNLASGVYFSTLRANGFVKSRKILLLR